MSDVLARHRAFYDAVETGDLELMESLWADAPTTSCVHPGAEPLTGTESVLRSWAMLMANVGYIQFFLTDVAVSVLPGAPSAVGQAGEGAGDAVEGDVAVVTCTENILSGEGVESADSFSGGKAVCTSVLVRSDAGAPWKFWSRHASPVLEVVEDEGDE
ncbi:nuclear transport factor 2 family protein [Aeromicrobium sp. CTD01-1L150]|uniref:nuclear transport factor 2 family protein n=1 Tax=Aeromicrobium sp. CTD01-1L150 TaxID=3341830 RepID=UPI0035C07F54